MIRLYLTDFSSLGELPPEFNRDQHSRESFAAIRTLELMYATAYPGERMPSIKRTPEGKPYFAENPHGASFSISHAGEFAAVLLSDEGECGVDVEPELDYARAARIDKRFLSPLDLSMPKTNSQPEVIAQRLTTPVGFSGCCELTVGKIQDVISLSAYPREQRELRELDNTPSLPPVSRWTLLEAVLKADGRGFSAYKSAHEIIPHSAARHYLYTEGERKYYISVAVK